MKESRENPNAFKHWIGPQLLERMGKSLREVDSRFDASALRAIEPELLKLELKPRVQLIRVTLKRLLPPDYPKALEILLGSARQGKLEGFDLWPYSDFIQHEGLDHCRLSLEALRELTPRFSSEFAVRPYLIRYPKETLAFLARCAKSENVHHRRWASEGTRPRLPWGLRLAPFVQDPAPTFPILELLKHDSEDYVRRSVANHWNDVAKDHPERVVRALRQWQNAAGQEHASKIDWIARHALRSLIKQGHAGALELIGVSTRAQVEVKAFEADRKKVRIGEKITFSLRVKSRGSKPQKLVIDYGVTYARATGKTATKVFKWKTLTLGPYEEITLEKRHSLKDVSIRRHHPGKHSAALQINGRSRAQLSWLLVR